MGTICLALTISCFWVYINAAPTSIDMEKVLQNDTPTININIDPNMPLNVNMKLIVVGNISKISKIKY